MDKKFDMMGKQELDKTRARSWGNWRKSYSQMVVELKFGEAPDLEGSGA